jgi:hypothetical protein
MMRSFGVSSEPTGFEEEINSIFFREQAKNLNFKFQLTILTLLHIM